MLTMSELTSRFLDALPPAAMSAANRLVRLGPEYAAACQDPDYLAVLLQRNGVSEQWQPWAVSAAAVSATGGVACSDSPVGAAATSTGAAVGSALSM